MSVDTQVFGTAEGNIVQARGHVAAAIHSLDCARLGLSELGASSLDATIQSMRYIIQDLDCALAAIPDTGDGNDTRPVD